VNALNPVGNDHQLSQFVTISVKDGAHELVETQKILTESKQSMLTKRLRYGKITIVTRSSATPATKDRCQCCRFPGACLG
jgi:hypothetical protein